MEVKNIKMDLLEIYFENFAWRGLRLQGKLVNRKKSQPHEFSISWHYSGNCWEGSSISKGEYSCYKEIAHPSGIGTQKIYSGYIKGDINA